MGEAEGETGAWTLEGRSPTYQSAQSAADVRALLRVTSQATEHLLDELDAAGLPKSVRQALSSMLSAPDRPFPWQTLDDFLTACEAYAFVTAPSALTRGDVGAVRHGAEQLLLTLEMLLSAASTPRLTWTTNAAPSMKAPLLPAALGEPRIQDALRALIGLFARLSTVESAERLSRRRRLRTLFPLGDRFLMPGSVLATALALIVFLLGTIGITTGKVHTSAGGMALKAALSSSTPSAAHPSTPSVSAHSATPSSAPSGMTAATTASGGATPIDTQVNPDPASPDPYSQDSYLGAPGDEGDPG